MYYESNMLTERNNVENKCQNRRKKVKVEIGDTGISI